MNMEHFIVTAFCIGELLQRRCTDVIYVEGLLVSLVSFLHYRIGPGGGKKPRFHFSIQIHRIFFSSPQTSTKVIGLGTFLTKP